VDTETTFSLYRGAAWLVSTAGAVISLIAASLALIPIGAGASFLVVSLTAGTKIASEYDPTIYWIPAVLTSLVALVATAHRAVPICRTPDLRSITAAGEEVFKHLFTFHLAAQISAGFVFATLAVVINEGDSRMATTELLVISLFSIFVFVLSTTFTSFFMRSLIPWRSEHPRFSNAIAYTLSTLLGLIAGIYAFAGKSTFAHINEIGGILYQASVIFATVSATLVGAYVALVKNKHQPSHQEMNSDDGQKASVP
jgi:hypothetical protein